MSERKLIGKVSATEKYPSSCDDFQFWLSDEAVLSPFDIVCVENRTFSTSRMEQATSATMFLLTLAMLAEIL